MNKQKFAFILCSNDDEYLHECFNYLALLQIPVGFMIDTLVIPDAKSMTAGYNEAMKASDAKYKIYLHQDTFIRNRDFLGDILRIFAVDPQIGMIGMIGAPELDSRGIMWKKTRVGNFYRLDKIIGGGYKGVKEIMDAEYVEVQAVDGLLIATQYDIPWREDIFTGWDFYDVSQGFEFQRAGYRVVVPKQLKSWYIHDCVAPFLGDDYEHYRKKLIKAYPEFFPKTKIFLFCYSDIIKTQHIIWGLLQLGHEVEIDGEEAHIQSYHERSKDDFAERLKGCCPDYVITFDLAPEIAEACHEVGIPYIAWAYDSPLKELNGWFAAYPTTFAFCMDRKEIERMKTEGKKHPHLHYMHLAANVMMMGGIDVSKEDEKRYGHQLSMVAGLYDIGIYEGIAANPQMSEWGKQAVNDYVNAHVFDWRRDSSIYDRLSEEVLVELISLYGDREAQYGMGNRRYYEAWLGREITHRDRVRVLEELAKEWDIDLYTTSERELPKRIINHGLANATQIAPKIYQLSKINLNITLRSIETGTPLRIFDIMSVGGFVLSNYQKELADLFVIDKEIVVFESLDELKDKIRYYLGHDNERQRIARNGYEKVKRCYSYPQVLKRMIEVVDASFVDIRCESKERGW